MLQQFKKSETAVVYSGEQDLYQYTVYVGKHTIATNKYCSYWYLKDNLAVCETGNNTSITSNTFCVEIYGYTPETRYTSFSRGTDLPYVNGCSTKQLIPAVRQGDPTLQMLLIPSHTSEQLHHIHSTPRVVYVLKGRGYSIMGTESNTTTYELNEGDVLVLDKMVPHHFETKQEALVVLPLHIFSSTTLEHDHPMFNGTHKV
jgi:quercetin dioxygenase-like cupin family protein